MITNNKMSTNQVFQGVYLRIMIYKLKVMIKKYGTKRNYKNSPIKQFKINWFLLNCYLDFLDISERH